MSQHLKFIVSGFGHQIFRSLTSNTLKLATLSSTFYCNMIKKKHGTSSTITKIKITFSPQVSAIFCCNSSNSTMSQPATQVSVQPPDTFSIYSYNKQPVIGSDTLRSGPLGDTLRTETLRSAASPQYRVSDIDPDFARRFREEHY